MKVSNMTLSEGSVINNITLPSGPVFPANPNMGEKFALTALFGTFTAGEYHHTGATWERLAATNEVQAAISAAISAIPTTYKAIGAVQAGVSAISAGTYWLNNVQPLVTATGLPVTSPLPIFYLDPAAYPVGATLRLNLNVNVNAIATASTITISLRKVTRPVSLGGGAGLVIYNADATALAPIVIPSASLKVSASLHYYSADIAIPAAGMYALVMVLTPTMTASSSLQISTTVEVKY